MKISVVVVAIAGLAAAGVFRSTLRAQQAAPPQGAVAPSSGQPSQSVWDGVYTEEQAKRGDALFQQHCASCHGAALTGGEEAPPLTGGEFTANWNGLTVGDLLDRIRTTMPPDQPGKLSRPEYVDTLAYVLSANKFPIGKTELARETEVLKQIRFEATKP